MSVTKTHIQLFCHRLEKTVCVLKQHLKKTNYATRARAPLIDKIIFTCEEAAQCSDSDCYHVRDGGIDYLQKY
ncbi:hypothetical protein [Sporomusa aerivorans]|uniref:hypothetical protein n=1 Tax=Sporomusa aerivorans TaxID=204936 RepID=UPI00352AB1BB